MLYIKFINICFRNTSHVQKRNKYYILKRKKKFSHLKMTDVGSTGSQGPESVNCKVVRPLDATSVIFKVVKLWEVCR